MKNKTTLLLTALFISLLVTTSTMGQGRFSIAPTFSPSYQHLNWVLKYENADAAKGSESTTGISVGLTASYAFTPKWSLSAGFLYNRSSGDRHFDNFIDPASTQSYQYKNWQLPLLLNYIPSTHRLSPYFSAGLLANHSFLVTNTNTMHSSYNKIDNGLTYTFSLYGMVGMGVQYRVTPKLALIVQPTAAYRINPPSGSYSFAYSPWNEYLLGLQTQVKFTF
ncbi:outer membrane beta-barrel protein [Spirosoma sp. HMF4905]|uniref:Outer membrane beta-barrel protein n=1 Tax=Spirosoma arboris TaxID=2682092 RepID=A0A7K1SNC5_9BACT|nr:outer membrane beta-barrel protein [Spirosoma arboris]MVM35300.1 outer membrane beta-barrel protein [Spirosoma arboris]